MTIFILACIIGAILGTRLAYAVSGRGFVPKALKSKKKPDYALIAELENLNEIEHPQDTVREIAGVSGYKTKIARDSAGDLELSLIGPDGKRVSYDWVLCKDYLDPYGAYKELLPIAEIEKRVKKKFDALIKTEKTNLEQKQGMDALLKKFNNKAVEL